MLKTPVDLKNYKGSVLATLEVRDASGAPVIKSAKGTVNAAWHLYLGNNAGIIEEPGHCYYEITTYTSLTTNELLGREISSYHCIPVGR